jgi:hypothetical protein
VAKIRINFVILSIFFARSTNLTISYFFYLADRWTRPRAHPHPSLSTACATTRRRPPLPPNRHSSSASAARLRACVRAAEPNQHAAPDRCVLNRRHQPVLSASGGLLADVDLPLQNVPILPLASLSPAVSIGTCSSKESTSSGQNRRRHACLPRCQPPQILTLPSPPAFSRPLASTRVSMCSLPLFPTRSPPLRPRACAGAQFRPSSERSAEPATLVFPCGRRFPSARASWRLVVLVGSSSCCPPGELRPATWRWSPET